jgi:hypothetical protein
MVCGDIRILLSVYVEMVIKMVGVFVTKTKTPAWKTVGG